MILIITHKEDYTADIVINKLNQQKIPYHRFNTESIYDSTDITISSSPDTTGLEILLQGENVFKSVWFRRVKLPELSSIKSIAEKNYILSEIDMVFKNLWSIIDSFWLSKPFYVYRAENKLLQIKAAKKVDFLTPRTLISNRVKDIKEFYALCNQNIIIKPIFLSQVTYLDKNEVIFTNRITEVQIETINQYSTFPALYQEYIDKKIEIRVTVVGDLVFAAAVDSQKSIDTSTDWRKGKERFFSYKLPSDIERKCTRIVKELNLEFGAIDLILRPNGDYVFLEVNPNGQWGWIEFQTNQDISGAIIKKLMHE